MFIFGFVVGIAVTIAAPHVIEFFKNRYRKV